jgi:hypothetical protein
LRNPLERRAVSENQITPNPTTPGDDRDWRQLAEKASHENDPKKLIDLVKRLCEVLDQEKATRGNPPSVGVEPK